MATFYVGLTMAGAVSAGAYSAGVFDFLVEALEAWEQRKDSLRNQGAPTEDWDVPSHDVVIPVMSGASAGGITGALGLVALADPSTASVVDVVPGVASVRATLPRVYDAWVRMPCFVAQAGSCLLGDKDLKAGEPAASLLDTTLLWEIVEKSLRGITALRPPRPYIGRHLHLYLTHTNLRGVPYAVRFLNDGRQEQGYDMMCHADRVHYVVEGIGRHDGFDSPWVSPENPRRLSAATLLGLRAIDGEWKDFALAALGSGAFPAGLSARAITGATVGEYNNRQWPMRRGGSSGAPKFDLVPKFPAALGADETAAVGYVTVDGGLINNEPFELARWTLMTSPPDGNLRDPLQADRAVVMIDPFPEAPDYDGVGKLDASLATVIRKLLPSLKNQARFKPEDAAEALDETIYSRYLIAPRRRRALGQGEPEKHAIACGLLGGFGGFLAKEFRAHDYQLGRLNAYLFLKNAFALPLDCPSGGSQVVLGKGYGPAARIERFQTRSEDPAYPGPFYQVIPVLPDPPEVPRWPRVEPEVVEEMVRAAARRADAVFAKLRVGLRSRVARWVAGAIWWAYGKSKVEEFIRWTVRQDLIRRDQLQDESAEKPEPFRLTMAGLADPSYDYRTVGGIAAQYRLTTDKVDAALQELRDAKLIWDGPRRSTDNALSFTLKERRPGWLARLPIVGQLGESLLSGVPAID